MKASQKVLILAIIFALITTFLIYVFLNKADAPAAVSETEFVTLPVAAAELPSRHVVAEADIKLVQMEKSSVHPASIIDTAEIIGKKTSDRILAGEPFFMERLAEGKKSALAYNIPEGTRAVTIVLSEACMVSGMIRPGDYVDVIVTFESETSQVSEETSVFYPRLTKTFLQNVRILAIGQSQVIEQETLSNPSSLVTLAVNNSDKEKLIYASQYGMIYLALRPVEDTRNYSEPAIKKNNILND